MIAWGSKNEPPLLIAVCSVRNAEYFVIFATRWFLVTDTVAICETAFNIASFTRFQGRYMLKRPCLVGCTAYLAIFSNKVNLYIINSSHIVH